MRTSLVCFWSLALGACDPRATPVEKHADKGEISRAEDTPVKRGDRLPIPPEPPPALPTIPWLTPLSEASIRKELGSGARCALVEHGAPLVVATLGDALVNDGGRLVHLKPEAESWQMLVRGGRFVATNLVIEISAGPVRGRRGDLVVRDTDLRVTRGKRGYGVFHGPPWVCGS